MEEFTFITSVRGRKLLVAHDFIYRLHYCRGQTSFWNCGTHAKCKGRALLKESGTVLQLTGFHNHEVQTEVIEKKLFVEKLKEKVAKTPDVSVSRLYKEELQATSSHAKDHLPSCEAISTTMYRRRNHALGRCNKPRSPRVVEDFPDKDYTFIPSKNGGRLLVVDNFLYHIHCSKGQTVFWKCAIDAECKGRVSLRNGVVRRTKANVHCHEPEMGVIQRRLFAAKLKQRVVEEPLVSVPSIYKEELAASSSLFSSTSSLPKYTGIATTLYRVRASGRLYNTLQGHYKGKQTIDSPGEEIPSKSIEGTCDEIEEVDANVEDSPGEEIPSKCLERARGETGDDAKIEDFPGEEIPSKCLERTCKETQGVDAKIEGSPDEEIPSKCLESTCEETGLDVKFENSSAKEILSKCLGRTCEGTEGVDGEEILFKCLEFTCEETEGVDAKVEDSPVEEISSKCPERTCEETEGVDVKFENSSAKEILSKRLGRACEGTGVDGEEILLKCLQLACEEAKELM